MQTTRFQILSSFFRLEWSRRIRRFEFRAAFILIFALMVFAAFLHSVRFLKEEEAYASAKTLYQSSLEDVTVSQLATMSHPALKPPWRLSFLVDGGQSQSPNLYRQNLSSWFGSETGLDRLPERPRKSAAFDWLFVLRVAVSLMAFVLGHELLCDRRQRARFDLIRGQGLPLFWILSVQYLVLLAGLSLAYLLGAAASLALFASMTETLFTADEWLGIGVMILFSFLAMASFASMALFLSALSRNPERSLVVSVLIWLTAVVLIPAAGGLLSNLIQPLPSDQEVVQELREILQRTHAEQEVFGIWRPKSVGSQDGFRWERRSAEVDNLRADRQRDYRRSIIEMQMRQVSLARQLALLSPITTGEHLAETLLGTGLERDRWFIEQAWDFRQRLSTHFETIDRQDPASPHILFIPGYLSEEKTDPKRVPLFEFEEIPWTTRLRRSIGYLFLMISWSVCLLASTAYILYSETFAHHSP